MDLKEYQEFCSKGVLPATLEREPIVGFALGLVGETGEVVDDIKKRIYHGRDISVLHTMEELGDVMWYIANICNVYNISLQEVIDFNVKKLKARYQEMYGI